MYVTNDPMNKKEGTRKNNSLIYIYNIYMYSTLLSCMVITHAVSSVLFLVVLHLHLLCALAKRHSNTEWYVLNGYIPTSLTEHT
jgi:hypothetical protein